MRELIVSTPSDSLVNSFCSLCCMSCLYFFFAKMDNIIVPMIVTTVASANIINNFEFFEAFLIDDVVIIFNVAPTNPYAVVLGIRPKLPIIKCLNLIGVIANNKFDQLNGIIGDNLNKNTNFKPYISVILLNIFNCLYLLLFLFV